MTFYCLAVIALVSAFCLFQVKKHKIKELHIFHFLATYAYRAYLSNVFWSELLWQILHLQYTAYIHPFITLIFLWFSTWILSFTSAYLIHELHRH